MKSETLVHQHPPTPPNLNLDLQSGFHRLAQYNADPRLQYDDPSAYGTGYGSPGPTIHDHLLQHQVHARDQAGDGFGQDIQYDGFHQGSGFYQDGQASAYPGGHAVFPGSPPTPRSTAELDEAGRRTRSGRAVASPVSPQQLDSTRPKTASKSRKAKAGKSEKPKTPKLTAPLSELTKGMDAIPVRNMKEWVERSAETRRKEVEKRNGYVTRPMNSFMLYRSAYAERTKQWCLQNNHQVVSSVSGESWPLEPPEIRDQYNEYAKVERLNHQNAHPTYKFSPSKTTVPARKRKGEFSDEEPSDLEDTEWNPGNRRSRHRPSKQSDRELSYLATGMEGSFFDPSFRSNGNGMHKPSWEMGNEARSMPMPMAHEDPYNQYYQAPMHTGMGMDPSPMEDMRLRRVDSPSSTMQFAPDHALLGLPGGNAADLMQQLNSHAGTPLGGEPQVDPMLLAFDSGPHVGTTPAQHPDYRNGSMAMLNRELEPQSADRFAPPEDEYRPDPWQPDIGIGTIELESEFEKWGLIGDHQA